MLLKVFRRGACTCSLSLNSPPLPRPLHTHGPMHPTSRRQRGLGSGLWALGCKGEPGKPAVAFGDQEYSAGGRQRIIMGAVVAQVGKGRTGRQTDRQGRGSSIETPQGKNVCWPQGANRRSNSTSGKPKAGETESEAENGFKELELNPNSMSGC